MKCYCQMKYINKYYMFKQKVGVHKSCVIWSLCLKNLQSYVVTIILFLNLELWCNIFVIITKMAQLAAHSGVHILWVMKPLQKSPHVTYCCYFLEYIVSKYLYSCRVLWWSQNWLTGCFKCFLQKKGNWVL